MPRARSFCRVVFVWLLRACTRRFCAYRISSAACSRRRLQARTDCHQLQTTAAIALCNWQTVNSGFFPPQLLMHPRQEQIAHRGQNQVAFQTPITPTFVMVQAQLALLILKAALDAPARESHQQQLVNRSLRRRVADEVFGFRRMQNVASDDPVMHFSGQTVFVLRLNQRMLDLPHHGATLAVLDPITLPGLVAHRRVPEQVFEKQRVATVYRQTRCASASATTIAPKRPMRHTWRWSQPSHKMLVHLGDKVLLPTVQATQKFRLGAIPFVERQVGERDAVGPRMIIQFQGDVRFGPIRHRVRNPSFFATLPVVRPTFGQKQFAVEQAMKIVHRQAQMHGDDAVVGLALRATVLPLHARRPGPLLGITGFVDDADRARAGVLGGDDLLQPLPQRVFVPNMLSDKLLQRSHLDLGPQRDWLNTLALQVRQLSFNINRQVLARVTPREAVIKPGQELRQLRLQLANLLSIHEMTLLGLLGVSPKPLTYARSKV